jgi:spermidine synthase
VWIGEDEGQVALLIDGVVQSVAVTDGPLGPGYWPHMLPETLTGRALVLGMGGGTICHLLLRRFHPREIVAVERDPAVIRLARNAFGLDAAGVCVVETDAFTYVDEAEGTFEYVAVDLFANGEVPRQIFKRPFLRTVRRLLTPGGMAAVNFFKDGRHAEHRHRIETVFPRVSWVESGKNLIARCRPR